MTAERLTTADRAALDHLSRVAGWTFAYALPGVSGRTLARLYDRGLVEALSGRRSLQWRLSDAGRAEARRARP